MGEEMNFSFLKKINLENLDTSLKLLDKVFFQFSKYLTVFNNGVDDFLKEMSFENTESNSRSRLEEKKNRRNVDLLWGSKSNTKLWSD